MSEFKTALLMGGDSPEREVSLMSGEMVLSALQRLEIETTVVDTAEKPLSALAESGVGRVFNVLHGGAGENGEIQGALKMMGLPVTGSGVLASALAMDKHRAKLVWKAAGIPTPSWRIAQNGAKAGEIIAELGLPLFVKPSCGGSSTHSIAVRETSALADAIDAAAGEGAPAMIEELICGREYTASILDDEPLPLIEIVATGAFYDYHAKYVADDTRFICPCKLSAEEESRLQKAAMHAFSLLGCRHWGRVDFILTNSAPVFLEVNTVPGMTSHSLVPAAAKVNGLDYDEVVRRIWEGAA